MNTTAVAIGVEKPERREVLVEDVYVSVNQVADLPARQAKVDCFLDRVTTVPDAGAFKFLNDFYSANEATIHATATALHAGIDNKGIESAINTFGETTKIVMKGLDNLEKVHPFVGVAVLAFKLVVTLDLTRRENNRKVIALKIEMQSLISVLFELRHIRDPEDKGLDGTPLRERLGGLIEKIAKDIRECGSACDVYMKKGFLAKTIKSKKYESRLAAYGTLFEDDRTALERALTVHIALGVDDANRKLDGQEQHLRKIEEKLDMMLIFKKLNTPREIEVQKFLDENGGARACIEKDDLLSKLISKSGETVANLSDHAARGDQDLAAARKALIKELSEDMDEVMKKNLSRFERKLDMQNKQLEEAIHQQSSSIINAIFSGAHERINDQDLQKIWKDMGWKGSVKARHFVLALHDYFIDKDPEGQIEGLPNASVATSSNQGLKGNPVDDKWALAYVNVSHVQPILEAVDDDGTGFVSIKEVNTFAQSRPAGWTLLRWLAFWAEGWQTSISAYKSRIYVLLRKMFAALTDVLPSNRRLFDEFLDHYTICRIELLLRSTCDPNDSSQLDPELSRITELYMDAEEKRLFDNLSSVGFDLDTISTVALVTGPGRIERYIYPLLYLLLKDQLAWFTLGCTRVLNYEELTGHARTFMSVFAAVDERIQLLEAVLKQTHIDVQARLQNFAFGMFELSYGEIPFDVVDNTIMSWSNPFEENGVDDSIDVPTWDEPDVANLHYPPIDFFSTDAYDFNPPATTDLENGRNPIEGTWSGHCFRLNEGEPVSYEGLIEFSIDSVVDNTSAEGKGHTFDDMFKVNVAMNSTEESFAIEVILSLSFEDGYSVMCTGSFDPDKQTITGSWTLDGAGYDSDAGDSEESDDADSDEEEDEDEDEDEYDSDDDDDDDEEDGGIHTLAPGYTRRKVAAENQVVYDDDDDDDDYEDVEDDESEGAGGDEDDPDVGEREGAVKPPGGASGTRGEGQDKEASQGNPNEDALRNTFVFTRTPVDLQRCRYDTVLFKESPARARWTFACRAIRREVQRRNWSWNYLRTKMTERRRYIGLTSRHLLQDYAPSSPLLPEEKKELLTLRQNTHPSDGRLWESLVIFNIQRLVWHMGIVCDGCSCELLHTRLVCITCRDEPLTEGVDLCVDCKDDDVTNEDFTHDTTHTLLKSERVLHDPELAWMIPEARKMEPRIKSSFRAIEAAKAKSDAPTSVTGSGRRKKRTHLCACCSKVIVTQSWVCVECAPDTYVCMDCDEQRATPHLEEGVTSRHTLEHPLIFVRDSSKFPEDADPNAAVGRRIATLEGEVKERFSALESRVSGMEILLRKIASALKV